MCVYNCSVAATLMKTHDICPKVFIHAAYLIYTHGKSIFTVSLTGIYLEFILRVCVLYECVCVCVLPLSQVNIGYYILFI